MIPVVIDFETFYDPTGGYSLKAMPTMQYVRDPRFKALGAALRLPGKPTRWVPAERLKGVLSCLPWDRVLFVAHNAAFDAAILTQRYGHRPAAYACTMSMIRWMVTNGKLGPEQTTSLDATAHLVGMAKGDMEASIAAGDLGAYAVKDGEICGALFDKFWPVLPEEEHDYIDIHIRMSADPAFELDMNKLATIARQDAAFETLFPSLRKDDHFAAALATLGVQPEYKTTAKGSYKLATAKTDGWLERLARHPDKRVRLLAEARRRASSTIERTRAARFLAVGSPFPAPALYHAAHTGRGGGADKLNVLNLPRKDGLRQCLKAPNGHKLVVVDSAQIEPRVLAWLAGEERLLDIFRAGADPYIDFAVTALYPGRWASGREMADWIAKAQAARKAKLPVPAEGMEAEDDRQRAKAAVLALGFGQGDGGFVGYCERFGIPMEPEEAARIVAAYRGAFTKITGGGQPPWRTKRGLWYTCEQEVRQTGEQALPSGRKLVYPDLTIRGNSMEYRRPAIFRKAKVEGPTNLWHGLLAENKTQAAARDVVFYQTRMLHKAGWRVALSVYDEAVLVVRTEDAERAAAEAAKAFETAPPFMPGLPTAGEVHIMERYGK
jgi:DNA polymerase